MNENEMTINVKRALDLCAEFPAGFSPKGIKATSAYVFEAVMPFFDALIDQYFIECIDEETSTYKVTNRGRYILSMHDSDIAEDVILANNQKKALIIMSLMNGKISAADNSFNPHEFCNFEDLITRGFVVTDRDADNFEPFTFWLSSKGERFVKKHCIIL